MIAFYRKTVTECIPPLKTCGKAVARVPTPSHPGPMQFANK